MPPDTSGLDGLIVTWGQIKLGDLVGDEIDGVGERPTLMSECWSTSPATCRPPPGPPARVQDRRRPGYVYAADFEANGRGNRTMSPPTRHRSPYGKTSITADHFGERPIAGARRRPPLAGRRGGHAQSGARHVPRIGQRHSGPGLRAAGFHELHSHVWSALPLSAIRRLGEGKFSGPDFYGVNPGYPQSHRYREPDRCRAVGSLHSFCIFRARRHRKGHGGGPDRPHL